MTLAPIHREVVVEAEPAEAFQVFTERIGDWWPMGRHSVWGDEATVAFDGKQIIETGPSGETSVWGTVIDWNEPSSLSFTWHPGQDASRASSVVVTFTAAQDKTLVVLEHSGWEVYSDPQAAREEYENGWPTVLQRFATQLTQTWTWVALMHTPVGTDPVFAQPLFAEHLAFLGRLLADGYLIAGGPLLDVPGEGMTILRLPGEDRFEDAVKLAREDDLSVAQGLFTVAVRPWHVGLSGL